MTEENRKLRAKKILKAMREDDKWKGDVRERYAAYLDARAQLFVDSAGETPAMQQAPHGRLMTGAAKSMREEAERVRQGAPLNDISAEFTMRMDPVEAPAPKKKAKR